ncbi:MAG: 2-C-methyl-D-erythritol 4-phosphate cytidylyltransferase [Proteobacteria bacterium]|nr:2-C-methyl-D-erythritol 4-phosphate cytidylyltransferase [Pseudomonadota bacterium]
MTPRAAVIIPAAGFGTRMNLDHPKQYHLLAGIPILVRTVRAFCDEDYIARIVVVVPSDMVQHTRSLLFDHGFDETKLTIVAGGRRRQDSVRAGLDALDDSTEIVLVHDGARPLITRQLIVRCYEAALVSGAAIAAVPVKDTLKKDNTLGQVAKTINRISLWQAQTPQAARRDLLEKAYRINGDADVTDESSLLEKAAIPVTLVEGAETNIKITRPEDLFLAEKLLSNNAAPIFRIGHGYDAHRFTENRKLVLGGVTIPHSHGLAGHSDADVLTHALCDALLGATGNGDIGKHFPDSDAQFLDVYSISLLKRVIQLVRNNGFMIVNADITLICQAPRLAPFLPQMKEKLGQACRVVTDVFNIKATTTEGMGFTGRQEGIGCHAVVLLQK